MLDSVLAGKKTYLTAGLIAGLAIAQGVFHIVIPEWTWALLGAAGLGSVRAALNNI